MTKSLPPRHKPPVTGVENPEALAAELERLARWMDSVFRIPGLGLRFGLDPLLGLLPGAGDIASSVVSIYIFAAANRYGVSRATLLRMALNIVIDLTIGALPVVGDLFDAYWKSNQRNVELLQRHAAANPAAAGKLRRSDRFFVVAMIIVLCALVAASLALTYFIVAWFVAALTSLQGSTAN
jgi:hypothetical protein